MGELKPKKNGNEGNLAINRRENEHGNLKGEEKGMGRKGVDQREEKELSREYQSTPRRKSCLPAVQDKKKDGGKGMPSKKRGEGGSRPEKNIVTGRVGKEKDLSASKRVLINWGGVEFTNPAWIKREKGIEGKRFGKKNHVQNTTEASNGAQIKEIIRLAYEK